MTACDDCFDLGCYEATLKLALRGRELVAGAEKPEPYWNFTNKAGACLSYLKRVPGDSPTSTSCAGSPPIPMSI
jgi:hypothetical protein